MLYSILELYWSQETPERPLTSKEQRKVGKYYQQIADTLEGKTERFSLEVVDEQVAKELFQRRYTRS